MKKGIKDWIDIRDYLTRASAGLIKDAEVPPVNGVVYKGQAWISPFGSKYSFVAKGSGPALELEIWCDECCIYTIDFVEYSGREIPEEILVSKILDVIVGTWD